MSSSYPTAFSIPDDPAAAAALQAAIAAFEAPTTSAEGFKRHQEMVKAWRLAQSYYRPRDIGSSLHPPRPVEDPAQIAAIAYLDENGRRQDMVDDAMDMMYESFELVKRDVARYMGRLQETTTLSRAPQTLEIMTEFLEKLNMWLRRWAVPMKVFGDNKIVSGYTSQFLQLLHSSLPAVFLDYFHAFLAISLASLPAHLSDPPHTEELLSSIPPPVSLEDIRPPSPHLTRLGMLPRYSAVLTAVAYEEIERVVKEEAAKGWDVRRLPRIRQRVAVGLVNWIAACFETHQVESPTTTQFLRSVFSRFDYYLCKCLFDIRTNEFFDIIVDYPESLAALEDLKECLAKIDQRDALVNKLKASNLKRLLHPGAETTDVLTQYISTIRCLRILDPPGVLLHKVAMPIRDHLKKRPDTTRCIVAALVEGEELSDENDGGGGLIKDNNDDEAEDFSDPKWEPEPIDAAPEFRSGKAGDIVSTLVSIFETREVIIKELQALLAQRLMVVEDYDSVQEIRIIEMLKLRFGEQPLQICDVMLKDVADSKRIDDRIQTDIKTSLHPLIISHRFWPAVPNTTLHLTPKLVMAQQAYEDAFHQFKPDKHLLFMQHLGSVKLDLELADRTLQVTATPLQAAVIETMEAKTEWQVSDIANRLQADEGDVHAALLFFAEEGVVMEREDGSWEVLEHAEA